MCLPGMFSHPDRGLECCRVVGVAAFRGVIALVSSEYICISVGSEILTLCAHVSNVIKDS